MSDLHCGERTSYGSSFGRYSKGRSNALCVCLGNFGAEIAETQLAKHARISFGGQMHGLVVLDEKAEVFRPAILWNDGRTAKETAFLNEVIRKGSII